MNMSQSRIILLLFCCFSIFAFGQVGINTTNPLSTLDINGNLSVKVLTLSGGGSAATATIINDGVYISLDPRNNTTDHFSLPNPSDVPGRVYFIRNITNFDTAKLSIQGQNGNLRFFSKNSSTGSNTLDLPPNSQNKTIILVSDGFNWTYYN